MEDSKVALCGLIRDDATEACNPTSLVNLYLEGRIPRDSLCGIALAPLVDFLTVHACGRVCSCLESLAQWNRCIEAVAKEHKWSLQETILPLKDVRIGSLGSLMHEAFHRFSLHARFDLRGKEKAICRSLVKTTPEFLLLDTHFNRVASCYCGGWLMVLGPKKLRRDCDFLMDVLEGASCDLEFLHYLDEDFLETHPRIAFTHPYLINICPRLRTATFAMKLLKLDHSLVKHFGKTVRELPEVAKLCGARVASRLEGLQVYEETCAAIREAGLAIAGFRSILNSKLRQALCAYTDILVGRCGGEILSAARRVTRTIRWIEEKDRGAIEVSSNDVSEQRVGSHSSINVQLDEAAEHGQRSRSLQKDLRQASDADTVAASGTFTYRPQKDPLELEIKLANEQARLAKMAYEKKTLPNKKKTRSQKQASNTPNGHEQREEAGAVTVSSQKKKQASYPSLLSEKPLEDLLSDCQGTLANTRSRFARKILKKEAWAKKQEVQQSRLIEVFLGGEEEED